jgi:hypothetical protein
MTVADINALLDECVMAGVIEPIDEKDCHPLDWAEVVGIADEIFDEIYPEATNAA